MKPWLFVAACLLLTGCDDVLVTSKLDPIQDDGIVGVWANIADPGDLGTIERNGDGYAIKPEERGGKPTRFTLSRAGDAEFAQIEEPCANHVFSFRGDTRTCYLIVRLEVNADSLTFRQLDPEKFHDDVESNIEYRVATVKPKRGTSTTCVLIEAPKADLLAYLATLPLDRYQPGIRMLRKK
jgi:hypothetical protein